MTPRIRLGLIVGVVSLVITACVSMLIGICGPGVSLIAGAVAGFLTGRQERLPSQGEGAKAGAISGTISGAVALIGQFIGGIATLTIAPSFLESLGTSQYTGYSGDAAFWLGGLGAAFCFGLLGVVLSALAGAAGGYFGTQPQTAPDIINAE
jgi:hypothetical protein